MKKIASFLGFALALSMLATVAPATPVKASDASKLKPYEIVMYSIGTVADDHEAVVEEINKVLTEKFNATLKLYLNSLSEHRQKMSLMMAAQEKYDVTFVDTQYADYVAKQSFYPLTDLLNEYGQAMLESYPQNLWDSVTINNEIYAIPTHKYSCQHVLFNINETLADKHGLDVSNVTDWTSFMEFLAELKEIPEATPNGYVTAINPMVYYAMYTSESITGNFEDPGVVTVGDRTYSDQEPNKVFNQFETPEFMAFVRDTYAMAQAGILPKDPDPAAISVASWDKGDPVVFTQDSMAKRTPGLEAKYGVDMYSYFVNDATQTTALIYGSMNAIPSTSGDPARAMMFINELIGNKDFANLFFYGIEGKNWGRNDLGQIDRSMYLKQGESNRYSPTAAYLPGFLTADPDTSLPVDMVERYEAFAPTLVVAGNLGFAFDEEPVMTELAAIRSAVAEYLKPLLWGLSEPEENVPKFLKRLKDSGVDRVIAEQQRQLDEWREMQGKN